MSEASFGEGRHRRSGLPAFVESPARRLLARLAVHENVFVGEAFRVGRGAVISSPHGLRIGNGVSVGPHTVIQVDGEIGDFALIGIGVQIVGREDHLIDEVGVPMIRSTAVAERPARPRDAVRIGRDVWIGGASTVLSGVSIGDGAVIGAASVVTRDVPAFAVAVGNPARLVSQRFETEETQARHLRGLDALSAELFPRGPRRSAPSSSKATSA